MAQVGSKNTKPEIAVRKAAHGLGLRFRLHSADLPGKPDLVFRRWKTVLFVHGCFWHGHHCERARLPKTNVDYWSKKLQRNAQRWMRRFRPCGRSLSHVLDEAGRAVSSAHCALRHDAPKAGIRPAAVRPSRNRKT